MRQALHRGNVRPMTMTRPIRASRLWRSGAVALVAAIGAVTASGCGGGVASAIDPVAQAATASTRAPGFRMSFQMAIASSALRTPITATGEGSFDAPARSGSLSFDMNLGSSPKVVRVLGSSTLHLEEVVAGLTVYIKLPPALRHRLPAGKAWLEFNLAKAAAAGGVPGLAALANNPAANDPTQYLQYLRAASAGVTKVGTETVDGVQTTRYRSVIQLDRVSRTLPPASRAAAQQAIAALERLGNLHVIPIQVWIDRQHLVRELLLSFTEHVAGRSINISMRMNFTHYGPQQAPTLPPADQVVDLNATLHSGS